MDLSYHSRNANSASTSRKRILHRGCTPKGHKLWTAEEEAILVECNGEYAAIRKRLRHRTKTAIAARCQMLGLRKKVHIWTGAELAKLRRLYRRAPIREIEEAFPHSNWVNIRQIAKYHGFVGQNRKPYKLTGHPALDEVRRKCFAIRWTMTDLDRAAKTGTYFYRAGWIGKKINHRAIGRAIEALDGQIQACWNE